MELVVHSKNGKATDKKVVLDDAIFGIEPNDHAIYLDVKLYLANQRQGTHDSRERSDVAGSTRKIKRQKGTGTARAGDIKNPLFRGGGRIFGPHPRDYSFKLNKKVKKLARKSALAYKVKDNELVVVEDFSLEAPKTKEFVNFLKGFDLVDKKTLLVLNEKNDNIYLSARNLKKVKVVNSASLNTYDILNANKIIVAESSLNTIHELLGK